MKVIVSVCSVICNQCNGTGCSLCHGSGERPAKEWLCEACGTSGEGVPCSCHNCDCDVVVDDDDIDDEPDFDDYEPVMGDDGYYY